MNVINLYCILISNCIYFKAQHYKIVFVMDAVFGLNKQQNNSRNIHKNNQR